ncbi:uncharacterized protein HD556DRAFT_1450956 [Suillus plorans]|uniref:Uncharacterized protein n=1 Tax=Suillus plorans TaxID=116603 RepID=A0A9P7DB13_9AGAM|nr:uncharacterized protein HD556DRAFT_1450956 [Suillus plorans]KAG1785206.1 hypothetical protein HD556DRAFT_1450956 [Suillus plorans]
MFCQSLLICPLLIIERYQGVVFVKPPMMHHKVNLREMWIQRVTERCIIKINGNDKRIGILRDRSVTWLWDAFTTVNKSDIVKKAFEMCHVHTFNLSYERFWDELMCHAHQETKDSTPTENENDTEILGEAAETDSTDPSDDTNVPYGASVIADMLGNVSSVQGVEKLNGRLISKADAESMEFVVDIGAVKDADCEPDTQVALGRGKRKKKENTLYSH